VDEVWGLRRPDRQQVEQTGYNARLITVEKSRAGRDGSKLLMKLESDLTFSLTDYVEEAAETGNPASVVDRVLQRIRAAYPRSITRSDLAADPLCGGSVAGIRKATQRLVSRGLIRVAEERPSKGGGSPMPAYQAVVSREKPLNSCPTGAKTSLELESTAGQPEKVSSCSSNAAPQLDSPQPCPAVLSSDTNGSAPDGHDLEGSPRGERSPEELDQLMEEAARLWD
jgi:hypothetical protein